MTISMTGFAAGRGAGAGYSWLWDLRSVNGKGLDLRLRVPEWVDGLESALRAELQKALGRGNVSMTLKLSREEGALSGPRLNPEVLAGMLQALAGAEAAARAAGIALAPVSAADLLALRGVLETGAAEEDTTALRAAILADLPALLAAFSAMRAREGAALNQLVTAQLSRIAALVDEAGAAAVARRPKAREALREALERISSNADGFDEARIAQELALLAVKADVTEELDRLGAHITAARELLADPGPVGRKLDFLMQEFLREANTLLSKSQDRALTRIGLDLKVVIDQMREQVQNVE
ncbi:YicC/YloC family endoribonuclease [Pseudogemmobacter faecipullorum]|uniref:YicC family protein n=1 Tax=Pseudogemmobacter faecipullorum TaxID=2755041 RepID=A0ABS8CL04_9RHOB|nr:YicC/YloC family endoribonuclease [Pseudogemmobacter faecipullorum]MCB5410078.1 YicC family protein [Pseudogemmobacter faecipullorum]